jgi:hypothetical protein
VLAAEEGREAGLLPLRHGRIASFSLAYADQNERDHSAFARAVKDGKVEATFEDEAG